MNQPGTGLLIAPDELTLMIFNELGFEDRRAVIQTNRQLQRIFSPEFFECLGPVDVNFLNATDGEHDLAGYERYGHRLKNLSIHNVSRNMLPTHEEAKLREVLAPYCDPTLKQELDSLVFSTSSTLCNPEQRRLYPNSFKVLEVLLTKHPLPKIVVLPESYGNAGPTVFTVPFGAILNTSAIGSSGQRPTQFYLRPGTCVEPLDMAVTSHGCKVSRLSLFGSPKHHGNQLNREQIYRWLRMNAFDSLETMEFFAFELHHVIDIELPASIEALSFVDNTMHNSQDLRGQKEIMERLILCKKKHYPGTKPVLKKFVHRQTASWPSGTCTIAGEMLAGFVQETTNMLEQIIQQNAPYNGPLSKFGNPCLQYACHRHGLEDRSFEDIESFIAAAPSLVGLGINFLPILHTEILPMHLFEQEADSLTRSLAGGKNLKTLLLFTPATNATFNQQAKSNVKVALTYLVTRLAVYGIDLTTVFVVNRDILIRPDRRGKISHAARFRISKKTNAEGVTSYITSSISNNPLQFSKWEFDQLQKLGGDLLVTYHSHERDGMGALYLGKDEMTECQRKRDERLAQDKLKRQDAEAMEATERIARRIAGLAKTTYDHRE